MQGGPSPYVPGGYVPPQAPLGPRQTNVMAILALVFAFVCWPAGIVLGVIARRQIRETGEDGDGLALAGLILSCVFGGITLIVIIGFVALAAHLSNNQPTGMLLWHSFGMIGSRLGI